MKYTLIIADDEVIEQKALRLLIQKELPEIEIVAFADNGTRLVELVQRLEPDMAIVDVNMPGLNGIDAIDLLCTRGSKTHFIINTAYDTFDYVQRALALKVDAYLLKPDRRENTVATLRKLCAEIDRIRSKSESQKQMQALFTNIRPVLESEIMYSIFIGEASAASFAAYCEMHNFTFHSGAVMVLVPVIGSHQNGLRGQDKAVLRAAVDAAFGCSCTYLATVTESNICLLIFVDEQRPAQQRSWLSDVVWVAIDKLNRTLSLPLRAGIGGVYPAFERMPDSYREGLLALLDRSDDGINFYNPTGAQEESRSCKERAASLVFAVRTGNLQGLNTEMMTLPAALHSGQIDANELWSSVRWELRTEAAADPELRTQLEKTAAVLANTLDADAAADVLQSGMVRLVRARGHEPADPQQGYVEQALHYIADHYAEDLSLDQVAEQIGVSASYLSRLFRSEQGKTFVEYLTEVRMQAATRLACQTRLSIREIAQRTGYSNPTYFCRVFKKYTGGTIGDLREKTRKKPEG